MYKKLSARFVRISIYSSFLSLATGAIFPLSVFAIGGSYGKSLEKPRELVRQVLEQAKGEAFVGSISRVSLGESEKTITVKNEKKSTEAVFMVTDTTVIVNAAKTVMGKKEEVKRKAVLSDLVVGKQVAVIFEMTGDKKQATKIMILNFAPDRVLHAGERSANVLGASFGRFDKIIAKQEMAVKELKEKGKNVAKVENLIAQSKVDRVSAQTLLDKAREKFAAIPASDDPQAAAQEAQKALREAITAAKKVHQDLKITQKQIKLIAKL